MPYEPDLDKCLFSETYESDWERLTVSVFSYDKGAKKLQISRENKSTEGSIRFVKLGRLTKKEVESIIPLIQEALKFMD